MLRSDPQKVLALKYWSLVFVLGVALVFWKTRFHWGTLIFLVFCFCLTVFQVSLAVIEASDGTVRYRRLFNWKELPFDEIAVCGLSRVGVGIGYIRLKHFLWPLGKLYFILDEHMGRGEFPILTFIQKHIEQ
jgi:hypothetical protein